MDWSIVEQYLPLYQKAFLLTLHIAFWGILGSFLLGLIVSIIRHYRIPVLAQVATAYIELSRNTPLLIQLFFLYFGLPRIGIVLSSEVCATLGLVFLGGSYMAESFRSGLGSRQSNPAGDWISYRSDTSTGLSLCGSSASNSSITPLL